MATLECSSEYSQLIGRLKVCLEEDIHAVVWQLHSLVDNQRIFELVNTCRGDDEIYKFYVNTRSPCQSYD